MRTVIFDLDGTLADTSGDLIAAANSCFRGLGLGDLLDPLTDAATALRGGRAMLNLGFSRVVGFGQADVDAQYPVLLKAYAADIDTHTALYPGAMDAVAKLKSDGYRIGIATNKPERLAEALMLTRYLSASPTPSITLKQCAVQAVTQSSRCLWVIRRLIETHRAMPACLRYWLHSGQGAMMCWRWTRRPQSTVLTSCRASFRG